MQSAEGVDIAKKAGRLFYSELEKICNENSYPKQGVRFNIEWKQTTELNWEAYLYGNGGTARVEQYIPATNRVRTGVEHTDDAHIRIFAANYNLFDSYFRSVKSKKRTYEKHYYLTLNESKEPNWSEEKRAERGISTEALLSNIFLEFYEFTKQFRDQF